MNKRIHILDSLRGIAALVVFIHHFVVFQGVQMIATLNGKLVKVLFFLGNQNHLAVIFFFILSGLSVGLSIGSKSLKEKENWNNYFFKRFNRLLPIYWIALFITLTSGWIMGQHQNFDYSFKNLVGNLFFLQTSKYVYPSGWFTPYGNNGPLWSLSYEMFFYILFPFVYFINSRFTNVSVFLKLCLCVFLGVLSAFLNKLFFTPWFAFFSSFSIWILGYLLNRIYTHNSRECLISIFIFGIFSFIYLIIGQGKLNSETINTIALSGLLSLLLYFIITIFRFPDLFPPLKYVEMVINFIFRKIGLGSYAIYAFHYPLLLLLSHYSVSLLYQIGISIISLIIFYLIDVRLAAMRFSFCKIDYSIFSPFIKSKNKA